MVRAATLKDLPGILKILNDLKGKNDPTTGFASWTKSKIESELTEAHSFVYEEDGISGFILYRTIPDGYEITLLGTDPHKQKRGIMGQTLAVLLKSLKKDQFVWLEVHEGNLAARRLYEKMGFKVTGRRPRYYGGGAACLNLEFRL